MNHSTNIFSFAHVALAVLLCGWVCFSCSQKEEVPEYRLPQRTVLVYMAADNNLYRNAKADIEEMLQASIPPDVNLAVYLDAPAWSADTCPQLLHIHQGATPVKQYGQQNSASGQVLQAVIGDAMSAFPAESYGLILWSHGTGWLPEGAYDSLTKGSAQHSLVSAQSFGRDGKNEMGIIELAEALPTKFEFIIFDACLMGGVEVLYQLRGKANTIVASPTETLVAGLPYAQVLPCLFTSPAGYAQAAQAYMDYYKGKSGNEQTASIAVVSTAALEAFTQLLSRTLRSGAAETALPDREKIQKYDLLKEPVFYDLEGYLTSVIKDEASLLRLRQQLARAVIYSDCTPYFLAQLPLTRGCGLSIYLPSGNAELDRQYEQLDWYADSGIGLLR
jgi:hypothetical protein